MDLFGPIAYLSIGGNKYGLVIVDDFSRFTWVFFLHDKSETQAIFKKFARIAQSEFDLKIKNIRSENAKEFKNTCIESFLDEEGIKHEFSAPYSPQQNGVAERKNRTLIEMARTMLDDYKTSDRFWAEAINTACHAINRFLPVTNQMSLTFVFSVVSVTFLIRRLDPLSSLQKWMKVSCLGMGQMNAHTAFSTKPPVLLRSRVM